MGDRYKQNIVGHIISLILMSENFFELDENELEFSLNLARIKMWLEKELHRRLFRAVVNEALTMDPNNTAKKAMAVIAEDLNPSAFALSLQKIHEEGKTNQKDDEFCNTLMKSISHLISMQESMSEERLERFIKAKEVQFGLGTGGERSQNIEDMKNTPAEEVAEYLRRGRNYEFVMKYFRLWTYKCKKEDGDFPKIVYTLVSSSLDLTINAILKDGVGIGKILKDMVSEFMYLMGDATDSDIDSVDEELKKYEDK